jgi:hypothetical protein
MNLAPHRQQRVLLLGDDPHGVANVASLHAIGPDKNGAAVRPDKVDFGMPISKDMNMRRLMIIYEDHDSQTILSVNCDHRILTHHVGFFNGTPQAAPAVSISAQVWRLR